MFVIHKHTIFRYVSQLRETRFQVNQNEKINKSDLQFKRRFCSFGQIHVQKYQISQPLWVPMAVLFPIKNKSVKLIFRNFRLMGEITDFVRGL